jgi:RNA polymerase subunit RPABC4/transcription elongation factor Spt4
MVLIFFPLFPLPGLAIYLILRPRETLAEIYERSLEEEALLQGIEERLACPGCNRRIEEEFMICPTCHTRLKKACPACGRLLHLRWNICPYCGAVQTAVKAAPPPAPTLAVAVEEPIEAPRLGESRPSALAEPASQAATQPPEPETSDYGYDSGEAGFGESDPGESTDEVPGAYGEGEPADDDEEATPDYGPDRDRKTETLPFEFE